MSDGLAALAVICMIFDNTTKKYHFQTSSRAPLGIPHPYLWPPVSPFPHPFPLADIVDNSHAH